MSIAVDKENNWLQAIYYINNIQQDATSAGVYYSKLTVHVSDVYRPHHQEYIKV